jgi:purine-cytosine permease-like protein
LSLELNGINFISEQERHGSPRSLFWPWCAANVSFLAISYGAFFLGFGISLWQVVITVAIGTIGSFALVGISSLAGQRSSAPTMTLSRAAFGVRGNIIPGLLSYLTFVGWETVLVSLATLATQTVFARVGHLSVNTSRVLGFVVAGGLTIFGGVLGFEVIMRLQRWLTLATLILSAGYMMLTFSSIDWSAIGKLPSGNLQALVGATIFGITGIGLGWVNSAADYSRYLPRNSSARGVVGWTIFGSSVVPILMVIFGSLLAGSSAELNSRIASDPIGALTDALPTWYLVPFAVVAVLGLVGGAILDLYSSGLTLVSIGLPVKRHIAASIDGVIMTLGTVYFVWIASDFFGAFQGFLITLGVPLAAWSGIFVADVLLRKRVYDEAELFEPSGRYGSWNFATIALLISATFVGWGLVTNTFAGWLSWQGYLLGPIGGKTGAWAFTNIGVLVALAIGAFGYASISRSKIAVQEND